MCKERPNPKSELWETLGLHKQGGPGLDHYLSGEAIKKWGRLPGVKEHTCTHSNTHTLAPGLWRGAEEEEPWNKRCFVLANKSLERIIFK